MATLLDEVVAYLENEGVGTFGTDLFIGFEPATPKDTVTLFPTGGGPPDALDCKQYPTIQVRIRSETYPAGYDRAMEIYSLLHRQASVLATIKARCFALQSSPIFIGHAENGEFLFTQNYVWYVLSNS